MHAHRTPPPFLGTLSRTHATLYATHPAAQEVLAAAAAPHPGLAAGLLVNSAVFAAGIRVLLKGLTPLGVAHSWALGTCVYSAFGASGYLLVCLYFIFGSLVGARAAGPLHAAAPGWSAAAAAHAHPPGPGPPHPLLCAPGRACHATSVPTHTPHTPRTRLPAQVTKLKLEQKQREGIAEARSGRRGPGSVWGSGSAGLACALAALATGTPELAQLGFVASFTSKLSDTVSSEVGKVGGGGLGVWGGGGAGLCRRPEGAGAGAGRAAAQGARADLRWLGWGLAWLCAGVRPDDVPGDDAAAGAPGH
jgi:hypothetical protein